MMERWCLFKNEGNLTREEKTHKNIYHSAERVEQIEMEKIKYKRRKKKKRKKREGKERRGKGKGRKREWKEKERTRGQENRLLGVEWKTSNVQRLSAWQWLQNQSIR